MREREFLDTNVLIHAHDGRIHENAFLRRTAGAPSGALLKESSEAPPQTDEP